MKNFVFCLSFIVTHSLCSAMYDAQKIAVEKNVAIRQLRSTTFNDRSSKLCIDKLRKIAKRISANSDRKSIKPEFLVLEMADIQALIHIINIPVNFGVEVGHLWYIYMLIGLYLLVPILSPWLNSCTKKELQGYLILCSDGLTNMLTNEDILQIVNQTNFLLLSDKFIDKANENGGTDNITVIVVEI